MLSLRLTRWLRVLACGAALAACRTDSESTAAATGPLVLAAASDLAQLLPELTAAFQAETGIAVTATVGASGMLAQQIMSGAPVDVFASADRAWVGRLDSAQLTLPDTRVTYARGTLVLVTKPDKLPELLLQLSDDSIYQRIAIANPEVAPYGRAARQALERGAVWHGIQSRLVIGENVRQTLEYVLSGNVDAALVARALVPAGQPFLPIPPEQHEPLWQDAVVLRQSKRVDDARRFVAFLTGDSARAILQRHHFTLPERSP